MSHKFVFREKFDRSTDGRMNVTSVNGKIADSRKGIRSITNEVLHGKIVMIMKIVKTKKEKSKKEKSKKIIFLSSDVSSLVFL